jgi:hypothetical protein
MSWQALRCVLEHLSFVVDDHGQRVATGNDQLVLIRLADRAHADGGGIVEGRRRMAKDAGLSDRTVKDALARLVKGGVLEREPGRGPRGVHRHRIPLCDLCRAERSSGYSGNGHEDRSSGYSGPLPDRSNSRMPTGAVTTPKPYRTLPGPRDLARLQAEASQPEPDDSGDPSRGGGLAPSPAPPAVGGSPPTQLEHPNEQLAVGRQADSAEPEWRAEQAWSRARIATVLPFQADRTSRPAAAGRTA